MPEVTTAALVFTPESVNALIAKERPEPVIVKLPLAEAGLPSNDSGLSR